MTLEPTIDNLREPDPDLDPDLAADLAALASPIAPAGLASRALTIVKPLRSGASPWRHFLGDWKHAAAISAMGFLLLVVAGIMLPNVGRARVASGPAPASVSIRDGSEFVGRAVLGTERARAQNSAPASPAASTPEPTAATPRQVIRTANLDVRVANVRDSYQNASSLIREDLGEFISQTTFTGIDPYSSATVTLRVNADRLQIVLQSLRGLGDVTSESTGGEDVTDQLVDLDARLRNERRIEQELLTLLDTRKDAPLEDILKVREHLGRIRESIERLGAQQAQLTNRVALATITARLVAKSEPIARKEGLLDYLGSELAAAWRWSLRALIDTISFLLALTVGGLIWWTLLGAIALLIRRAWRRHKRRLAVEPPPAI